MNQIELRITGAGSEMQGVGRLPDGKTVFIPGALPGEQVLAEITKDAPRFCEARLIKVLASSPERTESSCPYAGQCGGCSARHMTYAQSLRLKQQRVADALQRLGGVENPQVLEIFSSDATERVRNKAEYAVECRNGRVRIGCMEAKSHRVLPLEDCLLQKEESIRVLRWFAENLIQYACASHVRGLVTRVNRKGETMVAVAADAPVQDGLRPLAQRLMRDLPEVKSFAFVKLRPRPTHALDGVCTVLAGAKSMEDTLLGLRFELAPQSFFQVNPEQAERLYLEALRAVDAKPGMRIVDAYCGAGTITLAAAQQGAKVWGVEIVPPAIENAKRNAKINGLERSASFVCGDAAREIPKRIASGERFDAAILDPPRKGADAALLHALADANIPKIAYVSCNPSTLARDVKILAAQGYRLEWARPVDMFPWTEHVETVCLLARA